MKNLRLALRSLLHFRLYSIINMLGLALCLMCVLVIARYIYGELTVDRFNTKFDRMYAVTSERLSEPSRVSATTGFGHRSQTGSILSDHSVENYTNFMTLSDDQDISVDAKRYRGKTLVADSNFLNVFDYKILAGQKPTRPEEVILTESFVRRYFPDRDILGKKITHTSAGELTVAGILAEPDTKSMLSFDMIISLESSFSWMEHPSTVIILHPGQPEYKQINARQDYAEENSNRNQLIPYKDLYFKSPFSDGPYRKGNSTSVTVLGIVGVLILLIGILNFISIYTAVVLRRGREFGMKKVFGASGRAVFFQLWVENLIMIALALLIALALGELFNPLIRNLLGFDQVPFKRFDLYLVAAMLGILPLLTSISPFFRYNYSRPITSLRGVGTTGGKQATRKVLLVVQYTVTVVMIVLSVFFLKQLRFMLKVDPGFRTKDIISFDLSQPMSFAHAYERDNKEELRQIKGEVEQRLNESPLFEQWTYALDSPVGRGFSAEIYIPGEEPIDAHQYLTPQKWMDVFEIELLEGRLWNDEIDIEEEPVFIVSESTLKKLGKTDYQTVELRTPVAVWAKRNPDGEYIFSSEFTFRIVGVVKDFNGQHLSRIAKPAVFYYRPPNRSGSTIYAAIVPGKKQEAIEFLRQLNEDTIGGEFAYTFIEDTYKAQYAEDKKIATVYSIFTVIAILISAMGLFSISLFDVQQRFKEIAIRKVNGATTGIIIRLLLKRYMILLGISFVIAVPVAWFAIQRYLENFAYKTGISWWIFALALLITAGVSLLTLIHQTRKAAATNPAEVIRSE